MFHLDRAELLHPVGMCRSVETETPTTVLASRRDATLGKNKAPKVMRVHPSGLELRGCVAIWAIKEEGISRIGNFVAECRNLRPS